MAILSIPPDVPRVQQRLAALQPLGGIQERAAPDAERLLGFLGGEHGPDLST